MQLQYKNRVLRALDGKTVDRLRLKRVMFPVKTEIEHPGTPIVNLIFLEEGMASMTTTFENGTQVEVAMFGFESVIGFSALLGTKLSLNRVCTQIAGWGYQCSVSVAKAHFDSNGIFHRIGLRYVQAQLVQAMQTAGCNAQHNIEQRLSRWLLLCADRVDHPEFEMSQEILAYMLGTTRPYVTLAAGPLKKEKLIEYSRGQIAIRDRPGLEKRSCECYRVIKQHLDEFARFDTAQMG